ncbi:MAG: ATP-NAD kinase [Haloarculaceae archaeon]
MDETVSTVGLVGATPGDLPDPLCEADLTLHEIEPGSSGAHEALDLVFAVGTEPLLAALRDAPGVPVVPVAAGRGVPSIDARGLSDAVEDLVAGRWETETHPILDVAVDGESATRAAADVTLVTEQPAQISEYAVRSGGERVARFRADGVVLATPVGSAGYARRVGGPILAPGTGLVAAPVAPFATDPDHWVLGPDEVRVRVERDEAPVVLLADDRTVGPVDTTTPVSVSVADRATLAVLSGAGDRW